MQRTENIDISKIGEIFDSIFQESVVVYESDSGFDSDLLCFDDIQSLKKHFDATANNGSFSSSYALYYPDTNGYFHSKKIILNPEKCDGATYRYSASGWGIIHLQISLREKPSIEVRVSVNSAKRAANWSSTYSELKDPNLWDWKYVEKQARRIIRVLKLCA